MDITRDEFNGLGGRVSKNKEEFLVCRAENTVKLENMEETMSEIKVDIGKLFDGQKEIKESNTKMQGKIIGATAIIIIVIQVGTPMIMKLLGNIF